MGKKEEKRRDPPPAIVRKNLGLTWLARTVPVDARKQWGVRGKLEAWSAGVSDGVIHVTVFEAPVPENAPAGVRGPVQIRLAHARGAVLDVGAGVATGRGRPVTLEELDEVVHQFARGRLMALLLDGAGIPQMDTLFYELVEIGAAVIGGGVPEPPQEGAPRLM